MSPLSSEPRKTTAVANSFDHVRANESTVQYQGKSGCRQRGTNRHSKVRTGPNGNQPACPHTFRNARLSEGLVKADSDYILGFTAFGVGAGEILAAVQIAMIAGLPFHVEKRGHSTRILNTTCQFSARSGDEEQQS
jgi:hypothetical protein